MSNHPKYLPGLKSAACVSIVEIEGKGISVVVGAIKAPDGEHSTAVMIARWMRDAFQKDVTEVTGLAPNGSRLQ